MAFIDWSQYLTLEKETQGFEVDVSEIGERWNIYLSSQYRSNKEGWRNYLMSTIPNKVMSIKPILGSRRDRLESEYIYTLDTNYLDLDLGPCMFQLNNN